MTPDEVKKNQRLFEVAGAAACAVTFALILPLAAGRTDPINSAAALGQLGADSFVAISCYLGLCYLCDKAADSRAWDVRVNWMIISVIGTSALSLTEVLPALIGNAAYRIAGWEDVAAAALASLFVMNVAMLAMTGGVYLLGCVYRSAAEKEMRLRVVP